MNDNVQFLLYHFPFVRALRGLHFPTASTQETADLWRALEPHFRCVLQRKRQVPWDVCVGMALCSGSFFDFLPPCVNITTNDLARLQWLSGINDPTTMRD